MKKYFLVKAKYFGINEKGKEKMISEQNLVRAIDVKDAENNFRIVNKGTYLEDCDITSVSETKISNVFYNN